MLPFVPPRSRRVLDVGCSRGNFGRLLKETLKLEVWGVEPVAVVAAEAATKLDRVIEGVFDDDLDLPLESFDVIFFNDVLEHLFDPAAALRHARRLLKPDGVIVASIPNIRHFHTMWQLLVHGDWLYADEGILDRTHLRFFTRKSIRRLFEESQFSIRQMEGLRPGYPVFSHAWKVYRLMGWLPVKLIKDMRFLQFAVVAAKTPAA